MNLKLWQLIRLTVLIGVLNFITVSCYQPNSSTQGDLIDNNSYEASTPTDNNTSRGNFQGNSYTEQEIGYRNQQALLLAREAITRCYSHKELDECNKLNRIKQTVQEWCLSGDEIACTTFSTIGTMEISEQISNQIGN